MVFAICVMSNHVHLLVRDSNGELADWACYLLGNLARAINRIRDRSGVVFGRRYSAEPILDHEALRDRLVYVVTNPVQAGLCGRGRDWPGVSLWSAGGDIERHRVSVGVGRGEGADPGCVVVHPLPECSAGEVSRDIAETERRLRLERVRAGTGVLGLARVRAQDWRARPRDPKRSSRPPCHTTDRKLRSSFLESFRTFVAAFRAASAELRSGALDITFPPWSYPPGRPIVRVLPA